MARPLKPKIPSPEDFLGMLKASGLKEKLLFTLGMIALYRFGVQIPIYGVDTASFTSLVASGQGGNLLGLLDLFSGGALGVLSIFALGISPYITSAIIVQLVSVVIPYLEKLNKEEGEEGRRKIAQFTRYFAVVLALFQSCVVVSFILSQGNRILLHDISPVLFAVSAVLSLTAGAIFIMWLGELITVNGIGNGASLLIYISIITGIPKYIGLAWEDTQNDPGRQLLLLLLLLLYVGVIILCVILQGAERRIIIVNARRQVGANKVVQNAMPYIPFKLNPGGVMPIIFSVAILLFPQTLVTIFNQMNIGEGPVKEILRYFVYIFNPHEIFYYGLYFLLIIFLTYFYASIMPNMQPKEIANNLKKGGSAIPGVKPGKPTSDFLDKILTKTTFIGAVALGIIAITPQIATYLTNINALKGIGATALIIIVGVALDTIRQISTHALVRHYEGFLKN